MKTLPINRKNIFIAIIGIFIFSTMLYWQTAFFDFVWDDNEAITSNQNIRSLHLAFSTFYKKSTQKTLSEIDAIEDNKFDLYSAPLFSSEIKHASSKLTIANWRPLRTIIHSAVYKYFKIEPFWYHLLNIIGHGLVVIILFILLLQLTKDMLSAIIGSLLFAVHPLNTEVVCWAKSFEDLLATIFLLITFNLILQLKVKSSNKHNIIMISLASIAFALALSSKLSTIFFPIFMIMFFFYNKLKTIKLPFKAIANIDRWQLYIITILSLETITAVITRSVVLGHTAQSAYVTGSCWTTWLSMPRIFIRYLWLQVAPYPLFADYLSYPLAKTAGDPTAWSYAIVFILIFACLSLLFYKYKLIGPWLWFWCALIPFANIIAMQQLGAERFLYIPTIASAWLVAELFKRYINNTFKHREIYNRLLTVMFITIFSTFTVMTINRSKTWSSIFTLFKTTTKQFPESYRSRYNLIVAYILIDQPEKALSYAARLVKKYQTMKSLTIYAQTLCMTGNYNHGIKILHKLRNNVVLNRVGIYAAKHGKLNKAERCFTLALDIAPNNPRYKKNINLLQRQRRYMKK